MTSLLSALLLIGLAHAPQPSDSLAREQVTGMLGARRDSQMRRNVIVPIATSADGYIARPEGDLDWLTSRPAPGSP